MTEAHPDNVFLIGPMGAGKTTVGRRLARALNRPFRDADWEIERRTGVRIPVIFEYEGEAGFRRREHRMLEELTALDCVVLATGGGAVLDPANRAMLAERGWVVYLRATVDQQLRRTQRDRNRPLLQTEDPRARLEALQREREPLYREIADYTVATDERNVRAVVHELLQRYRERRADPR